MLAPVLMPGSYLGREVPRPRIARAGNQGAPGKVARRPLLSFSDERFVESSRSWSKLKLKVEVQSCSSEEVCGLDSIRARVGRRLEMSSDGLALNLEVGCYSPDRCMLVGEDQQATQTQDQPRSDRLGTRGHLLLIGHAMALRHSGDRAASRLVTA